MNWNLSSVGAVVAGWGMCILTHLWPFPDEIERRFLMIKHAGLGCGEVRILPQFIPRYWILSKSFKLWTAAAHFVLIVITFSSKKWQLMSCHYRHLSNVSLWFIVFSLTRTRHCLRLTSKFMVIRGKNLIITRLYNTRVWFCGVYFHLQWSQC